MNWISIEDPLYQYAVLRTLVETIDGVHQDSLESSPEDSTVESRGERHAGNSRRGKEWFRPLAQFLGFHPTQV